MSENNETTITYTISIPNISEETKNKYKAYCALHSKNVGEMTRSFIISKAAEFDKHAQH